MIELLALTPLEYILIGLVALGIFLFFPSLLAQHQNRAQTT